MAQVGRKSDVELWLYDEEHNKLLTEWIENGLSNKQIAHNMQVVQSTLYKWLAENKEFSNMFKKLKSFCDYEIENALYKRCTGYVVTLKKPIKVKKSWYDENQKKREEEKVEMHEEEQYIPPDTTAQIFWLKNRNPERWNDKQIIDANISGEESKQLMAEFLNEVKKPNGKQN